MWLSCGFLCGPNKTLNLNLSKHRTIFSELVLAIAAGTQATEYMDGREHKDLNKVPEKRGFSTQP